MGNQRRGTPAKKPARAIRKPRLMKSKSLVAKSPVMNGLVCNEQLRVHNYDLKEIGIILGKHPTTVKRMLEGKEGVMRIPRGETQISISVPEDVLVRLMTEWGRVFRPREESLLVPR
jgi:hypothetical protein